MNTLVGKIAPEFQIEGVNHNGEFINFSLSETLRHSKNGIVLFFYPLDFTFVCPTELVRLSQLHSEFQRRGVVVVGINTDSKFSHLAWRNQSVQEGGIGELNYTLLSDYKKNVTSQYGVLLEDRGVALRATFYIDTDGIVRHQSVNDLPMGRNIDEILRIVDAWDFHIKNGEVCPVDWKKGDSGMQPTNDGVKDYAMSHSEQ
jgi:peroxiredoxin (alkyl hydroperoxide reductase subunit C)